MIRESWYYGKKRKKVNVKDVAKKQVVEDVKAHYENLGYQVSLGTEFGLTNSTLILHMEECDIQIKIVAPGVKNGLRYTKIED